MHSRLLDTTTADGSARSLRLAAALYGGVLIAGVATAALALSGSATPIGDAGDLITLAGASLASFAVGALLGASIARRDERLPARLGRTVGRRLLPILPAVPFGALAGVSMFVSMVELALVVALGAAVAVLLAGNVLARVAQTRDATLRTPDRPDATWDWQPPSAPKLEFLLLVLWFGMGAANAVVADWTAAVGWTALGVFWAISCVAEGRWRLESTGSRPELRVHEAGLVERRPYTVAIVPWESIDHVRLRDDELVLDRGFFDVRIDGNEVTDLEGLRAAIERRIGTADSRSRVAN